MTKDQYSLGEMAVIRVESCGGDLIIRGSTESVMQVKGDHRIEETEKGYKIDSRGNLQLSLPRDTGLSIGRVSGDLIIKQFTGTTMGEYVHGDAVFTQAGDFELGIVHGDLVARNLIGTIAAEEVNGDVVARVVSGANFGAIHGDFSARVIDGDVKIDAIHGDADLRTVNGGVSVNQGFRDINLIRVNGLVTVSGVTGDIRLRGGLADGDHLLEARGDIVVRWPVGTALNIDASGAKIDNRLSLDDMTEKPGNIVGRIGKGGINLKVTTAGRVILREEELVEEKWNDFGGDMEFDFGVNMAGIAARIEAEVESHLSRVTRDLETKFGADFAQQVNEKVNRKVERASERVRRRSEARDKAPNYDFPSPTPAMSRKPASSEEQLRILKMVESGKISPEEAGMLLEALEA